MLLAYVQIIVTVFLAIIGWIIAHYFTNRREIEQKKRELTSKILIEAYYALTYEIAQRQITDERFSKLESTIALIQLFGSEEQTKLVLDFVNEYTTPESNANLDPIINSIRNSLREDLKLPKINTNVAWLRKEEDLL